MQLRYLFRQCLCGSVSKAVVSNTKGIWFKLAKIIEYLFTVNCELKRRKNKGPFF